MGKPCRNSVAFSAGLLVLIAAYHGQISAQVPASGGGGMPMPGTGNSNMPTTPEQREQERYYRDRVYGQHMNAANATTKQKATAMQDVTAILAPLSSSCKPTEAALVAAGPVTIDGRTLDTKTYEVACDNGLGYFLVAQPPLKPSGFSCFAAAATRAADVAQGKPAGIVCTLAVNADLKAMAGAALSRLAKTCQPRDLRWIGQNAKAGIEFEEIACTDGAGYVLKLQQPQASGQPAAFSCAEATKQGIPCRLTGTPGAVITIQTFKDALAQHNVACDASDVRLVGKQNVSKRHVVEFKCSQHPKGLVAFIPLSDSTAPFVTMDCAQAAKQGIACKLNAAE